VSPHPHGSSIAGDAPEEAPLQFRAGLRGALKALRRGEVVRWLVLLELANLMLDVFFGYLALYFVEVVHVSVEQAALGVVVWTVSEIVGNLLLIPLLERVNGVRYQRFSAGLTAIAFPCFLLLGPFALKLVLIGAIGLLRAGWYAILQARLYSALPGQSGIAVALGNLAGSVGGLIPLCLGAVAEAAGLRAAMWLLMAAPLALIAGLPWKKE
jgi:FSR family fosmidomycin resistance protein-like MFS transporter